MSRWSDLAQWHGPTPNVGGPMVEVRGLVVHIAEGGYEGTISWCRNPASNVSAHFVVARDGRIAQVVDTDITAWTQRAGNGHWLSVEFEGYHTHPLTTAQVEATARLFARTCALHGVPAQLATSPSGRGLGHHSMGAESGVDWGHSQCPGELIKAQKPAILARAQQLLEDDVDLNDKIKVAGLSDCFPDDPGVADNEIAVHTGIGSGYKHSRMARKHSALAAEGVQALRGEVAAMRTVIEQLAAALTAGGGTVDTAGVLVGVDQRLVAFRAELAAAAKAEADALAGGE